MRVLRLFGNDAGVRNVYTTLGCEQEYFLKAIRENLDLSDHMEDALNSMRIVAGADESYRTGKTVEL